MGTSTRVPETVSISGDELSADDAVTALRKYGRWNLVKNSFVRFRYADGFSHSRALALQLCLSFIPVGVLLAWASFTVVLERAPRRRQPGHSWLAFGAGVSLVLWLLLTGLLALYVVSSGSFGSTYGPLTGIFALLLWANLSSVAIFLGIAFGAQLEAARAGSPEPTYGDPLTAEPTDLATAA